MAEEFELREVPEPAHADGSERLQESATDWITAGSALTVAAKAIWDVRRDMRQDAERRPTGSDEALASGSDWDDYYPGLASFDIEPFDGFGIEDDDPDWYP